MRCRRASAHGTFATGCNPPPAYRERGKAAYRERGKGPENLRPVLSIIEGAMESLLRYNNRMGLYTPMTRTRYFLMQASMWVALVGSLGLATLYDRHQEH